MGGLISPITNWPYFADHRVARFRRSSGGLISAITQWLYTTDHQHAIQDWLFKAIRMGLNCQAAAGFVGITGRTFCRWKRKGKQENSGPVWEFCQSLKKAEVFWKAVNLKVIEDASAGGQPIITTPVTSRPDGKILKTITHYTESLRDWQDSAWFLERRFKEEWGRWGRSQSNPDEKDSLDRWLRGLKKAKD